MIIRPAQVTDSLAIWKLETVAHGEEVTSRYDIPMFIHFGYVFVAEEENKIIGSIIALKTKQGDVTITDWVVHPQFQHRGIGLQLYRVLQQEVKDHDLLAMV